MPRKSKSHLSSRKGRDSRGTIRKKPGPAQTQSAIADSGKDGDGDSTASSSSNISVPSKISRLSNSPNEAGPSRIRSIPPTSRHSNASSPTNIPVASKISRVSNSPNEAGPSRIHPFPPISSQSNASSPTYIAGPSKISRVSNSPNEVRSSRIRPVSLTSPRSHASTTVAIEVPIQIVSLQSLSPSHSPIIHQSQEAGPSNRRSPPPRRSPPSLHLTPTPRMVSPPVIDDHLLNDLMLEFGDSGDESENGHEIVLPDVLPVPPGDNGSPVGNLRVGGRDGQQLITYLAATRRVNVIIHDLGQMLRLCRHCQGRYFVAEINTRGIYTKCCNNSKIRLPALLPPPPLLLHLFDGRDARSRNFKLNILQYNYAFQFISTEANLRDLPGRGPYVYAIQGKIYHHVSDVNVNRAEVRLGPVYFLDPEAAVEQRLRNDRRHVLDVNLIRNLGELLAGTNPFVEGYHFLREIHDIQNAEALARGDPIREIALEFVNVRGREFDLPLINEVAAVYRINERLPATPNLRIFAKNQHTPLRLVNNENANVDPLTFPLLFPRGDPGWNFNILYAGRNITLCEYYAYRLAYRDAVGLLNRGGRLLQQYVVHAYLKIEANRMKFILLNQGRIRAEQYVGLADYLHHREQQYPELHIGNMVVLPSTFIGSPRSQQQRFQDAMAVVAQYGTPSLFITVTCNPKWPEIIRHVPQGEQVNDHPMLIARVFQQKLKAVIREILNDHIFGVPVAQLHVVEFQKRGLPHAHILTVLRREDKLLDSMRIDELISAEIPDPAIEPELYELVATHMVHGPCGHLNPRCPCMEEQKCSKKFPKLLAAETEINMNGGVTYRRRIRDFRILLRRNGGEVSLDNSWIVPYNPYFLLKYRCHINVEACASNTTVKYLYKYFFKHPDQALMQIRREDGHFEYNEVESFLNGRYMSPPEASWHINQFQMHENTHTVIRLAVHLPQLQIVRFQQGREREALDRNEHTQLTAWMLLNREHPEARVHLYTQIPHHYVWAQGARRWRPRQRGAGKIIVRMYSISFRSGDLYYLRLLLLHVRGATSYEDLRTVDGIVCPDFREACRQRNLLADDGEWRRCLTEAVERQMPYHLRQLFAYMLVFCEVADPLALWVEFSGSFIEDFLRDRPDDVELAERRALQAIDDILRVHGKTALEFRLPLRDNVDIPAHGYNFDAIDDAIAGENFIAQLNVDQRAFFEIIVAAVRDVHRVGQRLFFLDGPGGTGKTFLYNTLISYFLGQGVTIIPVAWTGLAANLLKQGRTLHSRFKLPVPLLDDSVSRIRPNSAEGRKIIDAKLIIWDEISMATRVALEILDATLKDLCQNQFPFGGKVLLVGGDFRQCLPVVRNGHRLTIVDACVKNSVLWPLFRNLELRVNVRAAPGEEDFATWLLNLGNGQLPRVPVPFQNCIAIPRDCLIQNLDDLIATCFGDNVNVRTFNTAILTPLNEDCHGINRKIIQNFPGQGRDYYSADILMLDGNEEDEVVLAANYTVEFLNSLTPSGMPSHKLTLKIGTVVMLLRNLNVRKNLCNGTRLIIRHLGASYVEAEKLNSHGVPVGETVFVPRIDCTPTDGTLPFKFKRRQFPFRLAYAITINKAQGQTLDRVGIYLPNTVFAHGQLYVAFSRARRLDQVHVCVEDTPMQGKILDGDDTVYTKNIVYPEAL